MYELEETQKKRVLRVKSPAAHGFKATTIENMQGGLDAISCNLSSAQRFAGGSGSV
jgi:hypothetical protein